MVVVAGRVVVVGGTEMLVVVVSGTVLDVVATEVPALDVGGGLVAGDDREWVGLVVGGCGLVSTGLLSGGGPL